MKFTLLLIRGSFLRRFSSGKTQDIKKIDPLKNVVGKNKHYLKILDNYRRNIFSKVSQNYAYKIMNKDKC